MRKDLPPVKDKPTGKQLRVYIRLASGAEACLYVSNEVSGQYHVLVPSGAGCVHRGGLQRAAPGLRARQAAVRRERRGASYVSRHAWSGDSERRVPLVPPRQCEARCGTPRAAAPHGRTQHHCSLRSYPSPRILRLRSPGRARDATRGQQRLDEPETCRTGCSRTRRGGVWRKGEDREDRWEVRQQGWTSLARSGVPSVHARLSFCGRRRPLPA